MRKTLIVLVVIAVLWLGALYINGKNAVSNEEVANEEVPKVGFQAPRFALEGLDGKRYSLENLKGKPVVINFWASWCGPCEAEAPELVKLYEQYKGRLEIFAVNVTANDSKENAEAFAKEFGFQFPVLLDPKGEVADAYQVAGFPTTFFVNSEGIIEDILLGYQGPELLAEKFAKLAEK